MVRKLPEDPAKRRLQHFKRLYQHREHFRSLLEEGRMTMPLIITVPDTGEEICFDDMMVGLDKLPPRQREAFELICLQGWTETDATRKMLPESKWSTPVQQYADTALARMVTSYDEYQAGTFVYSKYEGKVKKTSATKKNNPRSTGGAGRGSGRGRSRPKDDGESAAVA